MPKHQKYSEELLLEAVVKFSEIEKNKIKATELAEWCRNNMEGLEEVRDYHFMRSVTVKDEKTGTKTKRPKRCTLKIEEINKSRSLTVRINNNLLLNGSDIDAFMEQPDSEKRKAMVEAQEITKTLLAQHEHLKRTNAVLLADMQEMLGELDSMKNLQADMQELFGELDSLKHRNLHMFAMLSELDGLQKGYDILAKKMAYLERCIREKDDE